VSETPLPAPLIGALPQSRPFIAPEELARRAGRSQLVRLGANESAFGPPPKAVAAMRAELERASWYGDPESMDLREALAARHGCGIENITVGAGIDDLLGLAVRAYLAPGDVAVATLGSYPTYAYHVTGYGATLATVPYNADGSLDLAGLAALAHERRARHVYLANPDNPSGAFAPAERVREFADVLPRGALLVLDEAYGDFVAPSELLPDAIDPRIVRMRTFSKAYGLAGARIAYCIADAAVVATFAKIRLQFGVNRIAQAGALAALGERAFAEHVVAEIERGREEYHALGARLGLLRDRHARTGRSDGRGPASARHFRAQARRAAARRVHSRQRRDARGPHRVRAASCRGAGLPRSVRPAEAHAPRAANLSGVPVTRNPERFAVLSDIHGNLEALKAVLARLGPRDGLLCLGDTVGYGPNPNECVTLVAGRANATVLGNHDVGAVDGHGLAYFNPSARAAIDWTQTVLDAQSVAWLDAQSYEIRTPEYLLVHGAPVDYFTYILDMTAAARAFAATDAPLVFVGHTHVAEYYALAPDGSMIHAHRQNGGSIALEPGTRYIVNVGSVGQPRDHNPDASFVFYDPRARCVEWERVPYEISVTQGKICAAHLPETLAERLTVGR
jgi:histidinol-phosphate aminotransferase